jgi:hypothetical protein
MIEYGNRMQPKWVQFVELQIPLRKTRVWDVESKDGNQLGVIKFYGSWRCYSFFPLAGTLYEHNCLWDIADFCAKQTTAWREGLKKCCCGDAEDQRILGGPSPSCPLHGRKK